MAVDHPNIVTVFEIDRDRSLDFIVMEYIPGTTLDELISKRRLSLEECLAYALQMVLAISAIHSAKRMHRDLKPLNFMITRHGVVKLMDFGLAKALGSRHSIAFGTRDSKFPKTREGTIMGTVGYMSPEQVQGREADQRTDIFSFGAIFYEMLSGVRAFNGDSPIDTMHAILHASPGHLPKSVPREVTRLVNRCLSKKRGAAIRPSKSSCRTSPR